MINVGRDPEATTDIATLNEDQTRGISQNNDDRVTSFSSRPSKPPPQSAGTEYQAGGTKQALPKQQQPRINNVNHPAPSSAFAKDHAKIHLAKLDARPTDSVNTAIDERAPATSKPTANIQHHGTLALSRPRRGIRKTYTEVDWYEDLRPTDDESDRAEGGLKGSLVSSPDPDYIATPRGKSPLNKRKMRQSGPSSSKRRKSTKGQGKASRKGDAQGMQLPLTAPPAASRAESPGATDRTSLESHDAQPGKTEANEITDASAASLPPNAAKRDRSEDRLATQQYEVIEISSSSPLNTDKSDSHHDMSGPGNDTVQAAEAQGHGRGKSVGQKLADALRISGLSVQRQPATNSRTQSTHMSQKVPRLGQLYSSTSRTSSSRDSLEYGVLAADFDLEQVQSNPTVLQQEVTEQMTCSMSEAHEEPLSELPETKGAALPANNMSLRERYPVRELSVDQTSSLIKGDQHVESSQRNKPCRHSEAVRASERPDTQVEQSLWSDRDDSQAILQRYECGTGSPRSSIAAITDGPTSPLTGHSGNEQTPESQKPLLTKQTSPQPTPLTIPRSTIVDDNGSPRLITRALTKCSRAFRLPSETPDSGSCEYRQDPEGSDDYTPNDRSPLSKFQLDMLLEYGVEAEYLLRGRGRTVLSHKTAVPHARSGETNIKADQHAERPLEARPTTASSQHSDNNNAVQRENGSSEKGKPPTAATGSSQRTIDEVGLCAGRFSEERRREKLLSTETPSHPEPSSEPSRVTMLDDTDSTEWISALQAAQQSAHSLLRQTNQVRPVGCKILIVSWVHWSIELVRPACRRAGHHPPGIANLPPGMQSHP